MHVISSSYGNDSVALIAWAVAEELDHVTVVYCDTGWADPQWSDRVELCEEWVRDLGMKTHRTESIGFEELVRMKKGFPCNQFQFCTMHLKGVPFLNWLDDVDPKCEATVLVGKRRAESVARRKIPEFVDYSEHHGGRILWCPLYKHTDEERNDLLAEHGFEPLPHRSQECSPCVNANREDLKWLQPEQLEKVCKLEVELGKPLFRPKRYNALGIHGVLAWAKYGNKRENLTDEEMVSGSGCEGHYGCGL